MVLEREEEREALIRRVKYILPAPGQGIEDG